MTGKKTLEVTLFSGFTPKKLDELDCRGQVDRKRHGKLRVPKKERKEVRKERGRSGEAP